MTIAERLKAWREKLAASLRTHDEILDKANAENGGLGRTLTTEEKGIRAGQKTEMAEIEEHIKALEERQTQEATEAVEPTQVLDVRRNANTGAVRHAPAIITREAEDKFQGQSFTRLAIAKACAHINQTTPSAIAEYRWGKTNPTLVAWIKANEVSAGGAASGAWGAELVQADSRYTGDFIDFLYAQTVYDRLPLRSIPADVVIKGQDGASTGYFVGEGKAIPATNADFSTVSLSPLKAAALAIVTKDLIRRSSPSAEQLVRDSLVKASGQVADVRFVSATAASSGVSPAGILNGISDLAASGLDLDALYADVRDLINVFVAAKNFGDLQWVTHPSVALALSLMHNDLGQAAFPTLTVKGGTFMGFPMITGENVNANDLILLKPDDIYRIDDRGVDVSLSTDATIEMATDPTGDEGVGGTPVAVSKQPVNLFQNESVAIKVVRSINYAKRRASGVVTFIGDANYGTNTPTA